MSLLTERQIADILDILNVCGTSTSATELMRWSEKQQPLAQFEPDWSKAPKDATSAALDLSWWITEYGNWSYSKRIATYERPAPVITPHPHAELIAKYAEVAARRPDPWEEFEMRIGRISEWVKCDLPISFQNYWEYRHIGDAK